MNKYYDWNHDDSKLKIGSYQNETNFVSNKNKISRQNSQSLVDDIESFFEDETIVEEEKKEEEIKPAVVEEKELTKVQIYEKVYYTKKPNIVNVVYDTDNLEHQIGSIIDANQRQKNTDSYGQLNALENPIRKITDRKGNFSVLEYSINLAYDQKEPHLAYLKAQAGQKKRQLVMNLKDAFDVQIKKGAMSVTAGKIKNQTFMGLFDWIKKKIVGLFLGENLVYTIYEGEGQLILEPTEEYIVLLDIEEFGEKGLIIESSMFLAADSDVENSLRFNGLFSAIFGGEGLANRCLKGMGTVALKNTVPMSQMIVVDVKEGQPLRLDGNFAVCWSASLKYKAELSNKGHLFDSLTNDEKLVEVFEGNGKVIISPVATSFYARKRGFKTKYLDNKEEK